MIRILKASSVPESNRALAYGYAWKAARIVQLLLGVLICIILFSAEASADEVGPGMEIWDESGSEEVYVEFIDNILEEDAGFTMSFSYGFRNIAKSGRKLPFSVEISNNTQETAALTLELELPGSTENGRNGFDSAVIRYSYSMEIPAGETEDIRDTVSVSGSSPVALMLYNDSGELVCEGNTSIDLRSSEGSQLLIGILSRAPDRLKYLDGISLGGTSVRTRTVELDAGSLPDTAAGLEQLDILLVSRYDVSGLTPEGIQAIKGWNSAGGVLLIGTGGSTDADVLIDEQAGAEITAASAREVNMGLKYSKTGPDDAIMELDVCGVYIDGGIQVMQSDDIAMLTTFQSNNGITGVTAYDLCDISEFCENETEYAEDLLKGLLGSSRLNQLGSVAGGNGEIVRRALTMAGITNPEDMPGAAGYIIFAAVYITAVSFGSYFILRSHGMQTFYLVCCPILAFAAAVIIWLMGMGTRSEGVYLDYAVIRELGTGAGKDTGFIKLGSANGRDYSVWLDEDAEVYPVPGDTLRPAARRSGLWIAGLVSDDTGTGESTAVLGMSRDSEGLRLDMSGMRAFEGIFAEYSLDSSGVELPDEDIAADITYFAGEAGGTITNNTGYDLRGTVILMYGHVIPVGDIGIGETAAVDGREVIHCPIGASSGASEYVAGLLKDDDGGEDWYNAYRYSSILYYYMEESLYGYYIGARIVAYTEEPGLVSCTVNGGSAVSSGGTLIVRPASVSYEKDGYIWSNGMEMEPELISGNYDAAANTTTGSCVLEYSLGTGINVTGLDFDQVAARFGNESTEVFDGSISVYDYDAGGYVQISSGNGGLTGDEIENCLSPGNTVTVRYTARDIASSGGRQYLPIPSVTGKAR